MGTTASNFHLLIGDGDGAVERVATALPGSAYVAPPLHGWVSVFLEEPSFGDPDVAVAVAAELGVPAVDFFCFDSDIAVASLVAGGEVVDQVAIGPPGFRGDLAEMGDDIAGDTVPGVTVDWELAGDLDRWPVILGRGDREAVLAAVNATGATPFVEEVAGDALAMFGLDPTRLVTDYRFIEHGDTDLDSGDLLRTT